VGNNPIFYLKNEMKVGNNPTRVKIKVAYVLTYVFYGL
jgi:hypothetical protein